MTTPTATVAPTAPGRRQPAALGPGRHRHDHLAQPMRLIRVPEALFFSTLQPIMFVLLFRYVFGGRHPRAPGVPYVDYLMPGIFVQTVCFGAVSTAVGPLRGPPQGAHRAVPGPAHGPLGRARPAAPPPTWCATSSWSSS